MESPIINNWVPVFIEERQRTICWKTWTHSAQFSKLQFSVFKNAEDEDKSAAFW